MENNEFKIQNGVLEKYQGIGGDVTIPDNVTKIGDSAFYDCTSLTSITIPDSVTEIGDRAFVCCTDLTSIIIPDSVIRIGHFAFSDCIGLTSITIPDSVTDIGNAVFAGCTDLTEIIVAGNNPKYHSAGNCLIETQSKKLIAGCKTSKIPADGSVTKIGAYAFDGCTDLTSITIPDSITKIDEYAFLFCTDLTSIFIPNSVTEIGDGAFSCCTGLTSITILDNINEIGDNVFEDCITIPNSITKIMVDAFDDSCKDLTIRCVKGSFASRYAADNSIPFKAVNTEDEL